MKHFWVFIFFMNCLLVQAQIPELKDYNPVWETQSKNSSESMPVGGGDIGLNVWVEDGNVYAYVSKSGTFDENNAFLKLGRIKLQLSPNPFKNNEGFQQELNLEKGNLTISENGTQLKFWIDVLHPVIHVEMKSEKRVQLEASYESWRYKNRRSTGKENNANSYKWAPQGEVITYQDSIGFKGNGIQFYHQNRSKTVFDVAVKQQKLARVKKELFNPLKQLTFGGYFYGKGMKPNGTYTGTYQNTDFKGWKLSSENPVKQQEVQLQLYTSQAENAEVWKKELNQQISAYQKVNNPERKTQDWWGDFWQRSFIYIQKQGGSEKDTAYQVGQNYQLFRYMLGCNAYGEYPTKFNGGLFTYDPVLVDSTYTFTPDFRNWGGGTMTAQNQRLVYYPMLKSGDFDMMPAQFKFYTRILKNAELRSKTYWHHQGAAFTEQLENFGLPNSAEYEWDRPKDYDPGMQYNAWLEYEWDTVLEFCNMMLEQQTYADKNVREYVPFIASCLRFFDEHYQYLAKQRGRKKLNSAGNLVLYPGSGAETYKMAYNANSTIAGLQVVSEKMLELPQGMVKDTLRSYLQEFKKRIPPLNYRTVNGHKLIAPAKSWERINNSEVPQLYPLFPWKIFSIGKPGLQKALNTWKYDPDAQKFRSYIGWKQDNIFAARLGLTEEAAKYTSKKLANSERRFPAFWGPGFDWVPDHNWGGSGMIGLQEMLMQTVSNTIYLFPAWPKEWNVHFKFHAPKQTTVEVQLESGIIKKLEVNPSSRKKDIVNILGMPLNEKIQLNQE